MRLLVPELSKHVHNTFFIAALPDKRSSLLEKTIRIFPLAAYTSTALEYFIQLWKRPIFPTQLNYRSSSKIIRHVWAIIWLPVSPPIEVRHHVRLLDRWKSAKWSSVWWVKFTRTFISKSTSILHPKLRIF